MCIFQRDVYLKHLRRTLLVKCGRCPACLQEKANKRAFRIVSNYDDNNVLFDSLFCSFNYKPEFVPYIKENDLISFLDYSSSELPVYRDYDYIHFYNRHTQQYEDIYKRRDQPLKVLNNEDFKTSKINRSECLDTFYDYLRKKGDRFKSVEYGKIGVCLFSDVQNFIKRLRQYLKYRGYDFKISFYASTEYGETTTRPHVHLLLQVPRGYYSLVEHACCSCWKYGDCDSNPKSIQFAIKPASYIASYVNCADFVKGILSQAKPFMVKHSYSQGYGVNKSDFSFSEVLQAYERRNLTYLQTFNRDGAVTQSYVLLPKYVISRYFPKFKGFNKLTIDEVRFIVSNPSSIYAFAEQLQLTLEDCRRIHVMLHNRLKKFCLFEEVKQRYVDAYSNIWTVYNSNLLRMLHESSLPLVERYTNIHAFCSGEIDSDFISFNDVSGFIEVNPNNFIENLVNDSCLRDKYYKNNKKKKANSILYE